MSWLDRFFTSKNYGTVQDEGADVDPQPTLDFVGSGVAVTNDAANAKSIVTITAGGGSTPTGTGVPKIVGGVQDAAASLIVNADVNAAAAIAVSKLAAGTNTYVLTTTAGVPVWAAPSAFTPPTGTGVALVSGGALVGAAGTVNLASGTYVSGILPVANGGTGLTSLATFATLTGSQTLTNKTLTSPIIATISNTGTLTLPTSTDTLVGKATTDTLTNKTLTSPVISSPNFGSSTIATTGYFSTTGTVSTTGIFRCATGDKFCVRNGGNSADMCGFMHGAGDCFYIGLNGGFTEPYYQIIQCPSSAQYLGVSSNYFLVITNGKLEANAPITGYSGAEFSSHGTADSAMGDANYTVPAGERCMQTISFSTAMTATRTATVPHPSAQGRAYMKTFRNEATTGQSVTISTGTGTPITIASGFGQQLEMTTGGVRKAGDPFAL